MTINSNNIKWFMAEPSPEVPSLLVLGSQEILNWEKNNVWPDVEKEERKTGSESSKKIYIKVNSYNNAALICPKVFIETPTLGDDCIVFSVATLVSTEKEACEAKRFYGAGYLHKGLLGDESIVRVEMDKESGKNGHQIFRDGDLVRISSQSMVGSPIGKECFVRLAPKDAVKWLFLSAKRSVADLKLAEGEKIERQFYRWSKVSSCYEPATIQAAISELEVRTADQDIIPLTKGFDGLSITNYGAIDDDWVIEFTGRKSFKCSGTLSGLIGIGELKEDSVTVFNPVRGTDVFCPFFLIKIPWMYKAMPAPGSEVAEGNPELWLEKEWRKGDVIAFKTQSATCAIWEKRIVPARTGSFLWNNVVVAITGNIE